MSTELEQNTAVGGSAEATLLGASMEPELEDALAEFTAEMARRLNEKSAAGWTGWNAADTEARLDLLARAAKNLAEGDYIDAANFCMMLWTGS